MPTICQTPITIQERVSRKVLPFKPLSNMTSLPELIGPKKSKLLVYHQHGLPQKYKVHELRE